MRRGQGSRHFQISKAIFMDMRTSSTVGHRERFIGVLNQTQMRAPAVVSHPVEPTLPLRIARGIDHPQQGFTGGRHDDESEDALRVQACPT